MAESAFLMPAMNLEGLQPRLIGLHGHPPVRVAEIIEEGIHCWIGEAFQVTFTHSTLGFQCGSHERLSPTLEAPIRFRTGSTEVRVSTHMWHSDTQGVLCLRCREVVSHSEAFVQSRGDAVKPCLCDEPSDLLEPLTIDGNISPLCTRACAGDPDQKETRMHLRVPRHRADHTKSCEWFQQLPRAYEKGRDGEPKSTTMFVRIQVLPANANDLWRVYIVLCKWNTVLNVTEDYHRSKFCWRACRSDMVTCGCGVSHGSVRLYDRSDRVAFGAMGLLGRWDPEVNGNCGQGHGLARLRGPKRCTKRNLPHTLDRSTRSKRKQEGSTANSHAVSASQPDACDVGQTPHARDASEDDTGDQQLD
eukprot:m.96539 g.96539  ORF g.96539 m.96539 type:complete len:361 (+) comp16666_c0_seq2:630-1712(+)